MTACGAVGQRVAQRGTQVAVAVVDQPRRAVLGCRVELFGRRRHRGDVRAQCDAELHRRQPDATAGAEHHQFVARAHPRHRAQRVIGRAMGATPNAAAVVRRRRRRGCGSGSRRSRTPVRRTRRTSPFRSPGRRPRNRLPRCRLRRRPRRTRCPGTNGGGTLTWYRLATSSTSGKLTAAASTRTPTWPGSTAGTELLDCGRLPAARRPGRRSTHRPLSPVVAWTRRVRPPTPSDR